MQREIKRIDKRRAPVQKNEETLMGKSISKLVIVIKNNQ
jgi:hypothetical protein